jgi:hypothetical protein
MGEEERKLHSTGRVDRHQIPVEPTEDDFASISYYELSRLKSPEQVMDAFAAYIAITSEKMQEFVGWVEGKAIVERLRRITEEGRLREEFSSIFERFPNADPELIKAGIKTYLETPREQLNSGNRLNKK